MDKNKIKSSVGMPLQNGFRSSLQKWPFLFVILLNTVAFIRVSQGIALGTDDIQNIFHWNVLIEPFILFSAAVSLYFYNNFKKYSGFSLYLSWLSSLLSIPFLYFHRDMEAFQMFLVAVSTLMIESQGRRMAKLSLLIAAFFGAFGLLIVSSFSFEVGLAQIWSDNLMIKTLCIGISLMLLAVGISATNLDKGPLWFLSGNTLGAVLGRRLVLFTSFAPVIVALLIRALERLSINEIPVPVVFIFVAFVSTVLFAILWTLRTLHIEEFKRLKSDRNFESLVESLPVGILTVDLNGIVKFVNKNCINMLGYETSEIIGDRVEILVPEKLKNDFAKMRSEYFVNPVMRTWGIEELIQLQKKDGTVFPVEVTINPGISRGDFTVTCLIRDLTERKNLIHQLHDSQTKLNLVLNNLPIGVWFTDESGKIVFGNRSAYEIWGAKPGTVETEEKLFVGHLKTGEEVSLHGRSIQKCIHSSEKILNQVVDIDCFDGTSKTVLNSVVPILDEAGVKYGAISVIEDITVEYTRRERIGIMNRLGSKLNSLDEDSDIAKQLTHAVVPEFADWCGILFKHGDSFTSIANFHRDRSKEALLEEVMIGNGNLKWQILEARKLLATDESVLIAHINRDKYKELGVDPAYVAKLTALATKSYIMCPIVHKGTSIGIAFFGIDDSKPRRTYSNSDVQFAKDLCHLVALSITNSRLFKKARASSRAREDLLAIVAHDIRGPISTMLLASEMIGKIVGPENEIYGQVQKYSKIGQVAGERSLTLIQDLLDFAKIESGKLSVSLRVNKLREVIDPVCEQFKLQMDAKNLKFSKSPYIDMLDLNCDRERLIQVVANIFSNSIKFTPHGGTIECSARLVDNEIEMSFKDSGPGISAEHLNHMFDRFWQIKDTASLGSGLGLSIAKGIVEAHGGRIWAESELGRGCNIKFRIPRGLPKPENIQLALSDHLVS